MKSQIRIKNTGSKVAKFQNDGDEFTLAPEEARDIEITHGIPALGDGVDSLTVTHLGGVASRVSSGDLSADLEIEQGGTEFNGKAGHYTIFWVREDGT